MADDLTIEDAKKAMYDALEIKKFILTFFRKDLMNSYPPDKRITIQKTSSFLAHLFKKLNLQNNTHTHSPAPCLLPISRKVQD